MTANKNRQVGKRNERAIAKRLVGERKGIMGGEDVSAGPWSIECKSRKQYAISRFMSQCVANCPQDKTPLLILHEHNKRRDDDMVIMRLRDFELWFGKVWEYSK